MPEEVKPQDQENEEIDELEGALNKATEEEDIDGIEDDTKKDEETKEADKPEDKPVDESKELKQIIRQQAKDLAIMRARLERMEKKSTAPKKPDDSQDVDDIFKDDDAVSKPKDSKDDLEELSNIEILESAISNVGEIKGALLDTLLETMEQNPQYSDIREVCSQSHFNDIFDAVGKAVAEKHGTDPIEAALEFELSVWQRANPYKYMYKVIKDYHSDYVKEEPGEEGGKKTAEPAKAPSSLGNLPGGDAGTKSGWTAERIDNLPEDELDKVPPDVYDKYLAGQLD